MFATIIKRDGRAVAYDRSKIEIAIEKAMEAGGRKSAGQAQRLAELAEEKLTEKFIDRDPGVEDIQDVVEQVLMENGYALIAKRYILYRAQRTRAREMNTHLMRTYDELTFADAADSDRKRDNANVDGNTAMGTMLQYGSEGAKDYYQKYILSEEQSRAHREGYIHIHDLDFYTLTTTCCQIDLLKLFHGGFSTGHGFLREPNDIASYAALACIAIQSNQNDQHGGQSIPNFDYGLAPGVVKTYKKRYAQNFERAAEILCPGAGITEKGMRDLIAKIEQEQGVYPNLDENPAYLAAEKAALAGKIADETIEKLQAFACAHAKEETERAT